ncbi:MAG: hypothetical protein RLY86_4482 [Pseudomonadota bacterium]
MNPLVVDASVVIAYLLDEEESYRVHPLFTEGRQLMGPALLHVEVSNAIWKCFRKKLISAAELDWAVDRLGTLGIDMAPADTVWRHALTLAVDLDNSVYDCIYLATTIRTGSQLVTLDERFRRKLTGTPWQMLLADPRNLVPH